MISPPRFIIWVSSSPHQHFWCPIHDSSSTCPRFIIHDSSRSSYHWLTFLTQCCPSMSICTKRFRIHVSCMSAWTYYLNVLGLVLGLLYKYNMRKRLCTFMDRANARSYNKQFCYTVVAYIAFVAVDWPRPCIRSVVRACAAECPYEVDQQSRLLAFWLYSILLGFEFHHARCSHHDI